MGRSFVGRPVGDCQSHRRVGGIRLVPLQAILMVGLVTGKGLPEEFASESGIGGPCKAAIEVIRDSVPFQLLRKHEVPVLSRAHSALRSDKALPFASTSGQPATESR